MIGIWPRGSENEIEFQVSIIRGSEIQTRFLLGGVVEIMRDLSLSI